jgi:hypothetical protein
MKVHAAKAYADSERLWAEAARKDPAWDWPFYNLACSTALQGRADDAIAYLEMVRDRKPDPGMLARIETDKDLKSIRTRPEVKALIAAIADGILGRIGAPILNPEDYPPDWKDDRWTGTACVSLSFSKGKYTYDCRACCSASGTYEYKNQRIYIHLTRASLAGPEPREIKVNDYSLYKFGRFAGDIICLDEDFSTSWPPDGVELVQAEEGGMPAEGCYY